MFGGGNAALGLLLFAMTAASFYGAFYLQGARGFLPRLSIGMVIGPVTAALMSTLPLERAGAGSALTNTVRQTGSLLGIAVGGTIMSIAYRREIEASLHDYPGPVQDQARVSAEQARHAATATHQPALAHAADDTFINAMHVSAVWTMLIALSGAVVLVAALRPTRKPTDPLPEQEDVRPPKIAQPVGDSSGLYRWEASRRC